MSSCTVDLGVLRPISDKMPRVRGGRGCDCIDTFKVAEGCPVRAGGRDTQLRSRLRPCWKTGGKLGQIDDIRWLRG